MELVGPLRVDQPQPREHGLAADFLILCVEPAPQGVVAVAPGKIPARNQRIDIQPRPADEDRQLPAREDILARGKLPILVGGTGLYIDSLISGRDFAGRDSDDALRRQLDAAYETLGGEAMLARLRRVDPERADKLHAADRRRIVRALEIYELTGETITAHDERTRSLPPRYGAARIVLGWADRAELYRRIDARVDQMVADGLFDEVRRLLDAGLDERCTAMQAIGYKEPAMALRGQLTQAEAVEAIKRSSRRYAKRQLTWFSRCSDALRIDWDEQPDFPKALRLSTEFLHERGLS